MERTLAHVATTGDRLETLKTLRDRLAETIDSSDSARDIASLSKQMTEVLEQINAIENSKPGDEVTVLETVFITHREGADKPKTKATKSTARKPRAKSKAGA